MDVLKGKIQQGMEARGKNATGGTSKRIAVLSSGGADFAQAQLEADGQWKYVGNGRGPGAPPPVQNIKDWIQARGLKLNAYAVAKKIGKQGSFDFRRKRTNVFLDEIREWEKEELPKAEVKHAQNTEDKVLQVIDSVKFN